MKYQTDRAFAEKMDAADALRSFRAQFHIPKMKDDRDTIYLCGNSLGLQPRTTQPAILQELKDWQELGVEGHFRAKNPWWPYHESVTKQTAALVGARPSEVVVMNSLTVNLHLMMVSFYRPTPERFKIIIETPVFPSDLYAVESQLRFHGHDPAGALIKLKPRKGEDTLRTEDIEDVIAKKGKQVALVLIGGVNYYTGQYFDIARITKAAHAVGATAGFDLAHAAGNVAMKLHDWDVDFACWCSYKYLNAGPGSLAAVFVHERHGKNFELPRFCGWWGHDPKTRLKGIDFDPAAGAEGWQLSNPPILSLAAVKASLDIFAGAGIDRLREKSIKLTGYLEFLLDSLDTDAFRIMTPRAPDARGCQLSLTVRENGKAVHAQLEKAGVVCDWRDPDCIRVAPVPLYNSFADVHEFTRLFAAALGLKDKLREAV
ncbi:MAG TPA: kynureninase [Patescibacteria group bacterium]|nr:kynureninase [Patescibacteria group bacterium]